jgi:hypothetical protein
MLGMMLTKRIVALVCALWLGALLCSSCGTNMPIERQNRFTELSQEALERPLTQDEMLEYVELVKEAANSGINWSTVLGYIITGVGTWFGINLQRGPVEPRPMRVARLANAVAKKEE